MPEFECPVCEQIFPYRKILYNHMRYIHTNEHKKLITKEKRRQKEVICVYCEEILKSYRLYRDHLIDVHNVELYKQTMQFKDMNEFLDWKREKEQELQCLYVKVSGTKSYVSHKKAYYFCNKSKHSDQYKYVTKSKITRHESRKMNRCCPSTIEVIEKNGVCDVIIYLTHLGHDESLAEVEESVAVAKKPKSRKNSDKVDYEKVVTDVRNRIHSLNISLPQEKQDLRDISKYFWVPHYYHENDLVSLDILVKQLQTVGPESPILYYKLKGTNDVDEIFTETDFFLAIMTDFQKFIAEKFASKIICLDCNHIPNDYNFLLTTVITVDEFGEAVPIAFLLSSKADHLILSFFFELIKNRLGMCLGTEILMCEDKQDLYTCWVEQMVEPKRHLISLWDIDQNWRKQLSGKMRGRLELKAHFYERLRCLAEIEDEEEFKDTLLQFTNDLYASKETHQFALYFSDHSVKRPEQWAYCYRKNLGIHANVSLETTHKIVRTIYLEGRKFKRMDKSLQTLIGMVRQYIFKRIRNMNGRNLHRISLIQSSHELSAGIESENIQEFEFSSWKVRKGEESHDCLVRKEGQCKEEMCQLTCKECNSCVHTYTCTCLDNLLKGNMCEHIHAVCRLININLNIKQERTSSPEMPEEVPEMPEENDFSPTENEQFEMTVYDKIDIIREYVERNDDEIVAKVDTMLDECVNLIVHTYKNHDSDSFLKYENDLEETTEVITLPNKRPKYESINVNFEQKTEEFCEQNNKQNVILKVISPKEIGQIMNQMKPHVRNSDHSYV